MRACLAAPQVVDLAQKISDWRSKVGGGLDEGITIPKAQAGFWVPQVTLPAVSPCPPHPAPELSLPQSSQMPFSGFPTLTTTITEPKRARQYGVGRQCMCCSEH